MAEFVESEREYVRRLQIALEVRVHAGSDPRTALIECFHHIIGNGPCIGVQVSTS